MFELESVFAAGQSAMFLKYLTFLVRCGLKPFDSWSQIVERWDRTSGSNNADPWTLYLSERAPAGHSEKYKVRGAAFLLREVL